MAVAPALKQTEIGPIPADWDVPQICDLKPFVTSGSRGWARYYAARGAAFVRITNLSRSCIYPDLTDLRFVNVPEGNSEAVRTQLKDGDVLISITADIGIIGYVTGEVPKPAYINQHIALLRFDRERVCPQYVAYFLASEGPQGLFRFLTDSGAKAGMNLTTVQQVRLALPRTGREQDAIAQALSDTDALIASLERLLAKKRDIKQGAMQELLTGKRRLPGFSGPWGTRSLRSCLLATPDYGINAPAVFPSGDLPAYLRITDIDDEGRYVSANRVAVNHPHATDYFLSANEIVFARTGASVGKSYLYDSKDGALVFAGFLIRARIDRHKLDPKFFAEYTRTSPYWDWVRVMSMRSGQPGINGREFAALELYLPPTIEEQQAIAAILSDMDTDISTLEQKLEKATLLKSGMMQELLIGRIRLK